MASRVSLIQSRSIYVGTLNSVAPSDGNLIVTGNVGIGTTSPSYKLDVSGDIRSTNIDLATQGVNVSSYGFLSQTLSGQMTFLGHNVRASNTVNNTALVVNGGWISSLIKQYYNEGITFHTSTTEYAAGATYPLADTERMRITSAGNVGIGTTSPTYKLHVNGEGNGLYVIGANSAPYTQTIASFVYGGNSNSINIENQGGKASFQARDSSSNAMNLHLNPVGGNVGIGTTGPAVSLQVNASTAAIRLEETSASAKRLEFSIDSSAVAKISANQSAQSIAFETVGSERMRITDAGNVGIGTTSPAGTLDIGKNNATPSLVIGNSGYGANYNSVWGLQSGAQSIMIFGNNGQNEIRAGNTGVGGYLDFYTNNTASFTTASNGNFVMRLSSGGNVGIGTTSPSFKLDVAGAASDWATRFYSNAGASAYFAHGGGYGGYINAGTNASSSTYLLELISNGSTRVYVRGDGNVGIGTTNPGAKLEVDSASTLPIIRARYNASYYTDYDSNGIQFVGTGQNFNITDNGSSVLYLKSGGNVGIGTTSPAYKLSVNGTTNLGGTVLIQTGYDSWFGYGANSDNYFSVGTTSGKQVWRNPSSELMVLDASGNLGIGTTSPSGKLDVAGVNSYFGVNGNDTALYLRGYNSALSLIRTNVGASGNYNGIRITSNNGNVNSLPQWDLDMGGLDGITYGTDNFWIGRTPNGGSLSRLFFINSSGNVGIGTTSPASKLHVYSGSSGGTPYAEGITAESNSRVALNLLSGAANDSYVFFGNSSSGNAGYIGYENTANRLVLRSSDYVSLLDSTGEVIRIDGGNVGIGTTTPGAPLHVYKSDTYSAIVSRADWNSSVPTKLALGKQYGVLAFISTDLVETTTDTSYIALNYKSGLTTFAEGLRVYNNGNVGIGTTSPVRRLDVNGGEGVRVSGYGLRNSVQSANSGFIQVGGSNNLYGLLDFNAYDGNTIFEVSNTYASASAELRLGGGFITMRVGAAPSEAVRITSAGNVGIGTTAPDTPLGSGVRGIVINSGASNDAQVRLQNNATGSTSSDGGLLSISGGLMYLWNYEANVLIFGTNNSERMRLDSSGNLGVGNTSPSYKVDITGDARILSGSLGVGVAPNATDGRIDASNDIVAYSTSDQRLKENVTPIENALEKVKTLTGVEFDWKEETAHVHGYHGHDVGIIAQDVQAVLPEAVRTNESGYLSVRYEKMIALLIEGMKEQQKQIDELKAKLDGLTR
jgi:hypothetical protein